MVFCRTCFSFFLLISVFAQSEVVVYPDFTVSLLREGRSSAVFEEMLSKKTEHMSLFQHLYAKNILLAKKTPKNLGYRISPVVHQIWLGKREIPIKYVGWTRTWMNWLGWEYKLWTDEDVRYFNLYNQEMYDIASNDAEKSDIFRLEILLRYGGVYVDMDFECIKPWVFDELNRCFDLYMGFEPIEHGILEEYNMPKVCNALMAATAGHPFIEQLVINMKNNCTASKDLWTVEKTGPAYMTRELLSYELNDRDPHLLNMYLPCTFFYPFSEPEIWYMENYRDAYFKMSSEVAGIHYWGGSWKK